MAETFLIRWPSLKKQVECRKIEHNHHIFDWWEAQLPIKALQGHLMAAGWGLYFVSVPLNTPVNWEPRTETMEEIRSQKEGRLTFFMGNGLSGGVVAKYGRITEPMWYPTFCEVVEDDLPVLREVGAVQWHSVLATKEIIVAEFVKGGAK